MTAKGVILAGSPEPASVWPLDRAGARPLLPIGNRPILVHALEGMRAAGIEEAAVVAPPETADAVAAVVDASSPPGLDVELVVEARPGPVRALRAAAPFVSGSPFLVQAGEGLLRHDLEDVLAAVEAGAADAIALVGRDGDPGAGVVPLAGPRRPCVPRAWGAGAHVFGAELGERLGRELGADAGDAGLLELMDELCRAGGHVEARLARWWSRFDGNPRGLLRMNRIVLDELSAEPVDGFGDCQIEGRVLIDPTARVESAVISGPAVIGPGAVVRDAYIGPYTAVGDGARIENAEVEHSIVFSDAVIRHVGGRLEGSVIGRGARVFRDFTVPRALRLHVGDGAEVALH